MHCLYVISRNIIGSCSIIVVSPISQRILAYLDQIPHTMIIWPIRKLVSFGVPRHSFSFLQRKMLQALCHCDSLLCYLTSQPWQLNSWYSIRQSRDNLLLHFGRFIQSHSASSTFFASGSLYWLLIVSYISGPLLTPILSPTSRLTPARDTRNSRYGIALFMFMFHSLIAIFSLTNCFSTDLRIFVFCLPRDV